MHAKPKTHRLTLITLLIFSLLLGGAGLVLAKGASPKKMAAKQQKAAYKLFKQKCLSCHVSVADPERPGKTRDRWSVVVMHMDQHYVKLNDQEAHRIIDLLFAIRKGMEKDPG